MTRFLSKLALGSGVFGLMALLAGPVLAVSVITNSLSLSPTSFGDSQTVTMTSSTVYDWLAVPNPYPSNYVLAINYRHLRSPSIYYRNGVAGGFYYRSSIAELGNQPGYWLDNGGGWFGVGSVTYNLNATFKSVTACPTNVVEHWHGQTEFANSKGNPAIYSTTHTSC